VLVYKSLDEITADLVDNYDSLLLETTHKPLKVWRNNNNKLYLVFRSIAKGFKLILDAAIALRSRFDPASCEATDLYSISRWTGTQQKEGKGSMAHVTIVNTSDEQTTLPPGEYNFSSVSGMVFYFTLEFGITFEPEESRVISALSKQKGVHPVDDNQNIIVTQADGSSVNPFFVFSCANNSDRLGYPDETETEFRRRLLSDTNRQDHIRELELKIRNLPNIFECDLVFNPGTASAVYDGVTVGPHELLITITGEPTNAIARLVAEEVIYATCCVDPDNVVYYENSLYINGRYPVYYRYHGRIDFSLEILYRYDSGKIQPLTIEEVIDSILRPLGSPITRYEMISEALIHKLLQDISLPSVSLLDIKLKENDVCVPYIDIPKTRLPRLTGIEYSAEDTEASV